MSRRFAVILLHFMLCFCAAAQSVTQVSGVADSTRVVVLNSSTIVATVNPVKVLEDTVEYNPAAHRLAEDATLEDVLRKIPGLEINDGVVTLHGREIKQILIDGQRFFAGDIKAGLQNISADMISKVRSYEKESDFARMTGVDDGEREPVLDVKVKKNAIGSWNGTIGGGYGMYNRYVGKANVIRVDKNQQIAIMADFNDLNGKISINNASRTQLGGGSAGDAHRRSAGVNYSLKQKKFKCDVNASYSGSDALKKSDTFTERIYYDGITSFQGNGGGKYGNNVPSLEGKFEWTPVRDLVILVKPSFKYTDNRNDTRTTGTNYTIGGKFSSDVDNANVNGQNNFNSSLQFSVVKRNLARKKGRSLSMNAVAGYKDIFEDWFQTFHTQYKSSVKDRGVKVDSRTISSSVSAQLAYNEPLGKGWFAQITLYSQYNYKTLDRKVYDMHAANPMWTVHDGNIPGYEDFLLGKLTSRGGYELVNNKITIAGRLNKKKINLTVGLNIQPQFSRLAYRDTLGRDTVVRKSACYFSPNFHLVYRPTNSDRMTLSYRSTVSAPTLYNLLPVSNGTNPLYIHYGNESLLPTNIHKMEFSYDRGNSAKLSNLTVNASAKVMQNYVASNVTYDPVTGGTTTVPCNIDGNWEATASMVYNKSFANGLSLVQHAGFSFNNIPSFLYDSRSKATDIARMQRSMLKESFDLMYRIPWLQITGNVNADITDERCAIRPEINQLPYSFGAGLKGEFFCPWDMRLLVDFSFLGQRGYTLKDLNRNYYVLNASLSQPFLRKRLILSLDAYDLLGQLPNLTRSFNVSSRNIVSYNGYNRYVMLRLVYRFKI